LVLGGGHSRARAQREQEYRRSNASSDHNFHYLRELQSTIGSGLSVLKTLDLIPESAQLPRTAAFVGRSFCGAAGADHLDWRYRR